MRKHLFILGFFLLPTLANGAVYQWTDKDGNVHFGSVPPQQQGEYKTGEITHQPFSDEWKEKALQEKPKSDKVQPEKVESAKASKPDPLSEATLLGSAGQKSKSEPRFHPGQELKSLIQHLREQLKSSSAQKVLTETTKEKLPTPKKPITASPESVVDSKSKVSTATNPVTAEPVITAPVKTMEPIEKKSGDGKQVEIKKIVIEKDVDKCGVFTGFVATYEQKIAEECPGAHCAVYKRSLKKYKLKQKRYC